jgi:ATP/maltotriose-dependent transcriptional regulator MalT
MKTVSNEHKALVERIKELNCLYAISRLFSERSLSLKALLKEIVTTIPRAWQFPEKTCARICYGGREYRSTNYSTGSAVLTENIQSKKGRGAFVEVVCFEQAPRPAESVFLEDERRLLKAIAELLGSIVDKKEAEMSLRRTTNELRTQKAELEHKNIALREIVSQIGLEKKTLEDQMRLNIELTVMPLLKKMEDAALPSESRQSYVRVVQQNLEDFTSSFARKVIEDRVRLSPRELEICNLIKNGLANKEIAPLLGLSLQTVERHRHNVRRKLRIDSEKVNLATFLRAL